MSRVEITSESLAQQSFSKIKTQKIRGQIGRFIDKLASLYVQQTSYKKAELVKRLAEQEPLAQAIDSRQAEKEYTRLAQRKVDTLAKETMAVLANQDLVFFCDYISKLADLHLAEGKPAANKSTLSQFRHTVFGKAVGKFLNPPKPISKADKPANIAEFIEGRGDHGNREFYLRKGVEPNIQVINRMLKYIKNGGLLELRTVSAANATTTCQSDSEERAFVCAQALDNYIFSKPVRKPVAKIEDGEAVLDLEGGEKAKAALSKALVDSGNGASLSQPEKAKLRLGKNLGTRSSLSYKALINFYVSKERLESLSTSYCREAGINTAHDILKLVKAHRAFALLPIDD